MNIVSEITRAIEGALKSIGAPDVSFTVEPADLRFADIATNAALVSGKELKQNPKEVALLIVAYVKECQIEGIADVSVAGPGFVNFTLSAEAVHAIVRSVTAHNHFGWNEGLKGKKVIVEYTDPNPFKEFHIGHLMSNTIGESLARLMETTGADVRRACYQGDVGLHTAKAIWVLMKHDESILKRFPEIVPEQKHYDWEDLLKTGKLYAVGNKAYETDENAKKEIIEVNKKLYQGTDADLSKKYTEGRERSLNYFETMYQKLGTKFDHYFFESKTAVFGKEVVEKHPGIFEKSDGAIVYKGDETKGLHTRVFINKEGLPTYEAKELGLAQVKYDVYPYDNSIVITGNEVNDYFAVLLDAMSKVFPELAAKTTHIGHGMLRLPTGKMSSRTGDVITAESMIADVKEKVLERMADSDVAEGDKDTVAEEIAIGAIKYSILRQASGKDIVFDFDKSISFEGDSGPYIQYTHARIQSLLRKGEDMGITPAPKTDGEVGTLERTIIRFPTLVARAGKERAPQYIATYLIELAREFNGYYGQHLILDAKLPEVSAHRLAVVEAVGEILYEGLWMLGIKAPSVM